jgi:hypothetical protein
MASLGWLAIGLIAGVIGMRLLIWRLRVMVRGQNEKLSDRWLESLRRKRGNHDRN